VDFCDSELATRKLFIPASACASTEVVVGIDGILGRFTVKAELIILGPFAILGWASSLDS